MQAIRQIVDVKNHSLSILLPKEFTGDRVEVIVLPLEEKNYKNNSVSNLRGKLKLTSDQYNDFQQTVKDSRSEWDRNI